MINCNNYRARLLDKEDLDFITKLRTSNHVQENVGSFIFTNSLLQENWLEKISQSNYEKYLVFELLNEDKIYQKIGMIRLTNIDFVNRNMCVGGDICEEYINQGHGKNMYNLIFKLGFEIWGMNRLWLLVLENNNRAISLYKKLGFIQEGVQRQAIYKNSKYFDYLMMSILKN